MNKLFVLGLLIPLFISTNCYSHKIQIEVKTKTFISDTTSFNPATYDYVIIGLGANREIDTRISEMIKDHLDSIGLEYVDSIPDMVLFVQFIGFPEYDSEYIDKSKWINQTTGQVDSRYALLNSSSDEDTVISSSTFRSIRIDVMAPPQENVPIRIWNGSVTYLGADIEMNKLAPEMMEQLLAEYPIASERPSSREVILPNENSK